MQNLSNMNERTNDSWREKLKKKIKKNIVVDAHYPGRHAGLRKGNMHAFGPPPPFFFGIFSSQHC